MVDGQCIACGHVAGTRPRPPEPPDTIHPGEMDGVRPAAPIPLRVLETQRAAARWLRAHGEKARSFDP